MLCVLYSSLEKPHCTSGGAPGYLGITITETLDWKTQSLNVKNKANKVVRFIKRNLHSCPERIEAQAYISLVTPTLEYACASWDPYRKYQIDLLEQIHRCNDHLVTRTYSREEGCVSQALNNLHWPTLQDRRRIARLCMLYKTLNNKVEITVPTYVQHQQLQQIRHSHPLKFTPHQAYVTCTQPFSDKSR